MIDYMIKVNAWDTLIDLEKASEEAPTLTAAITQRNAENLRRLAYILAPFRTGEYRDSFRVELRSNGLAYQAEIGSDLPRGRALEFGGKVKTFNGRTATRPPRPHFRPAFEVVSNEYAEELFRYVTP